MGRARLRRAFYNSVRLAEHGRRLTGRLGIPTASGSYTFDVEDKPGWTACRIRNGAGMSESECINLNLPNNPNVDVWFDITPQGNLFAGGFVKESAVTAAGSQASYFGETGKHTHARGSGMEYVVETRLLDQGFVSTDGNGGMVVAIKPFLYEYQGDLKAYMGGTLDLTSSIPATASKQRMVVVVWKPDTAALAAVNGAEVGVSSQLSQADIASVTLGTYDISLMGVVLKNGMTAITDDNIFIEGRVYLPPRQVTNTAEALLSTTAAVNMNTGTATTLFTVPTGLSCIITRVVVRNASTSLTTASYSFGFNSAVFDNVIANATHTELTGSTLYTVLSAKVGATRGAAADTFKVLMNTLQGAAATTTMDVFGYLY